MTKWVITGSRTKKHVCKQFILLALSIRPFFPRVPLLQRPEAAQACFPFCAGAFSLVTPIFCHDSWGMAYSNKRGGDLIVMVVLLVLHANFDQNIVQNFGFNNLQLLC